ncbi:MAG TPA: hypothetical protein ENL37_03305 [Desulfobacteraceae bacterium]|nr:hypothetical protein [Desulfobacteraceae bacterium]
MKSAERFNFISIVIIIMSLFWANMRSSILVTPYKDLIVWKGFAAIEISFWFLAGGLAWWVLWRERLWRVYLQVFKINWLVIIFCLFAVASITWSVYAMATLYRALLLIFSTLIGAYIGIRYSVNEIVNILFWFGVIVVIVCLEFAMLFPDLGVAMHYGGAWRGFFWHRNHLGTIMALLNSVFLVKMLSDFREKKIYLKWGSFGFYMLSVLLIYFAHSVTGYVLFIVLTILAIIFLIWFKIRHLMKPSYYYIACVSGSLFLFFSTKNLDYFFSFFNRDISLTGRVPMWGYLIREVVSENLWIGSGFGALWTIKDFRLNVAQNVGWESQVAIGDNGFLDILLHLGVIGLFIFVLVLFSMIFCSLRYAYKKSDLDAIFPVLLMVFALVANISFSLFLELECFVWLVMVAVWFSVTLELNKDHLPLRQAQ